MTVKPTPRRTKAANILLLSDLLCPGPVGCSQIVSSAVSIPFQVAKTAATEAAKIPFEAAEAGASGVVQAILP